MIINSHFVAPTLIAKSHGWCILSIESFVRCSRNNNRMERGSLENESMKKVYNTKEIQKSAFEIEICHEISFTCSSFSFFFLHLIVFLWTQLVSMLLISLFSVSHLVRLLLLVCCATISESICFNICTQKMLSSSFGTIGIRFQFRFENAFAFNRFCLSILLCVC